MLQQEPGPPNAEVVLSRAIILKFQIVTALATPPPDQLAEAMQSWSDSERDKFIEDCMQQRTQLEKSLQAAGLWSQMTSGEQTFMRTVPTELEQDDVVNVSWSMESAEVMLWALGYLDSLPPYDREANTDDLKLFPAPAAELLRNATLRDRDAIEHARTIAELWHWRSRTRQIEEEQIPVELPEGMTMADIVRITCERAAEDGLFTPIDDDFPIFGKAYRDASTEEWWQATSIAMERHKALNWLSGYAPNNRWDETPTET